jgi:fibronectin-binding autotransporter adhesin
LFADMARPHPANPRSLPRRSARAVLLCGVSIVCAVLFGASHEAKAQTNAFTNATYTFGTNGNTNSFAYNGSNVANLTEGNMVKSAGISNVSSSGNFRANNWTTNSSFDANDYIGFTLTAASGWTLNMTNMTFGIGRSGTGTRAWAWYYSTNSFSSSLILSNYTTLAAGLTNTAGVLGHADSDSSWTNNVLNLSSLTGLSGVEFRLYSWLAEAGTGTAGVQGPLSFSGAMISNAPAASFDWTGSSGNWTTGFGSAPTNGSALTFSAAGGGAATNDLAALTVASVAFNSGAGSFTNSGNAFTISNGITNNATTVQVFSNAITLGAAQTFNAASGALTFAGNITNGGNLLTLTVASNATVSGMVSGDGGLTKLGAGTATISGANTFSGAVSVTAGALRATHSSALGTNTSGTTISSGAALELSGGITISGEALSLSGTGISSGGALRNISGDNNYGGAITLGAATRINSDADTLTLSGGISGAQNLTIGGAGNTTVSSGIGTSTGTLTKDGAGVLLLAGNNTFTGAVAHNGGTLALTNGNALADTVAVTLANTAGVSLRVDSSETIGSLSGGGATGGTVALDTNSLTLAAAGNFTYAGNITGTGRLIQAGSGTLTLSRTSNFTGTPTLRIESGALRADTNGGGSYAVTGDVVELAGSGATFIVKGTANANFPLTLSALDIYQNGTLMLERGGSDSSTHTQNIPLNFRGGILSLAYSNITGGTITYAGGANTLFANGGITSTNFTAVISNEIAESGGSYSFTKAGAGTLVLSGANTYTGDTVVNGGELRLSGSGRIEDSSLVTVSAGATMNFTNISDTIKGLSGAGSVSLGSATLTLSNLATDTFSGAISGTGSIVKRGTGTQVLSGANTYSGATTVAGGTLRIGGNTNLGNTNTTITLSNDGILEVAAAGTLTNAITIGAGNGVLSNSSAGALVIAGAVSKNGTVLTSRSGSGTNVFTGVISGANANSDFIVDGGTTVFSNVMTYNGPTIITNGGTLVLGTNNAMPSGSNLILGGGTFRVGVENYNTNSLLSMGTLTLTENSTIDLGNFGTNGDRNLVFANSSAINWTPGAILTITNWQGVALAQSDVTKLMFGTGGLDSDQMAQISFANQNINGGTLINGELAPIPEARIIWAALALTLLIIWRERRRWLPIVRSLAPPRH